VSGVTRDEIFGGGADGIERILVTCADDDWGVEVDHVYQRKRPVCLTDISFNVFIATPIRIRIPHHQRIPYHIRPVFTVGPIRTRIRKRLSCEPGLYYYRVYTWPSERGWGKVRSCCVWVFE
jgi:hypothetical protein